MRIIDLIPEMNRRNHSRNICKLCNNETKHRKPYCIDHIHHMDYVRGLAASHNLEDDIVNMLRVMHMISALNLYMEMGVTRYDANRAAQSLLDQNRIIKLGAISRQGRRTYAYALPR